MGLLNVIGIIFAILTFSMVVLLIVVLTKKKPDTRIRLENFMPQFSDGHTDLIVEKLEIGDNGRIKIDCLYEDDNIKNKYTLYFDKRQVESIPQGNLDMNRSKIKAYPTDINLLPDGLKETKYGKSIMEIINANNELNDESTIMKNRLQNLQKVALHTGGGEIFTDYISKSKELMKDLSDTVKKEEKKFGESK